VEPATRLATCERAGAELACTTAGDLLARSPCQRRVAGCWFSLARSFAAGERKADRGCDSSSSRMTLGTREGRARGRAGRAAMDSWRMAQLSKPTSWTALPRMLGWAAMGAAAAEAVLQACCNLRAGSSCRDAWPGRERRVAGLVGSLLGRGAAMLLPVVCVAMGRVAMGAALGGGLL